MAYGPCNVSFLDAVRHVVRRTLACARVDRGARSISLWCVPFSASFTCGRRGNLAYNLRLHPHMAALGILQRAWDV